MNNKVLVSVFVSALNHDYNVFIPIGRTVRTIKKIIMDSIGENLLINFNYEMKLIDKDTFEEYKDEVLVENTNIKNGTRLVLL